MSAFVVPHHVDQTSATLWVSWWDRSIRPGLRLRLLSEEGQEIDNIALEEPWSTVGATGAGVNEVACSFQKKGLTDLHPNTYYSLELVRTDNGQIVSRGSFETLPTAIPEWGPNSHARAQRPFTLFLGSCYYAPADPTNRVGYMYELLWKDIHYRPHMKLLVGDQVYLDQLPQEMVTEKSPGELQRWMIERYRNSWNRLRFLLSNGGNSMTSDDHEFWNDFPEAPIAAWPALSFSPAYRNLWEGIARQHFNSIQQPQAIEQIHIGEDLSIFIADTRAHREKGSHRFMGAQDFQKMIDWLEGLRQPGILVLGQPVIASSVGEVHTPVVDINTGINSDQNLPYYTQYWELLRSLFRCRHDLIVLSGDVHFGRIADWNINRDEMGNKIYLHEVIASPMSLLPGADGYYEVPENGTAYYWPPVETALLFNLPARRVLRYQKLVPSRGKTCEDHFMTLSIMRHGSGSGLWVVVRAWLIDRPQNGDRPQLAWEHSFGLDIGRNQLSLRRVAQQLGISGGFTVRGQIFSADEQPRRRSLKQRLMAINQRN